MRERAAAGEAQGEAVPRRLVAVRRRTRARRGRRRRRRRAGRSCRSAARGSGPSCRAAGACRCGGSPVIRSPDQRPSGCGAPLEEPGVVGRRRRSTSPADDPLGEAAVQLHLDQLRHRTTFAAGARPTSASTTSTASAPSPGTGPRRSTPCRSSCGTARATRCASRRRRRRPLHRAHRHRAGRSPSARTSPRWPTRATPTRPRLPRPHGGPAPSSTCRCSPPSTAWPSASARRCCRGATSPSPASRPGSGCRSCRSASPPRPAAASPCRR